MANSVSKALTNRRCGVPDSKIPQKNPSKNRAVMSCTGCGSDSRFYKKCNNPNKEEFREKKLKEIAETKGKTQKSQLRSYFLQMDEISSDAKTEADEKDSVDNADENDDDALNEYRTISDALNGNLDESMSLDSHEDSVTDTAAKETYDECLNTATRHAFFGSTRTQFGAKMVPMGTPTNLRYPPNHFPDRQWVNWIPTQRRTTRSLSEIYRQPSACPEAQQPLCHICPRWFEIILVYLPSSFRMVA